MTSATCMWARSAPAKPDALGLAVAAQLVQGVGALWLLRRVKPGRFCPRASPSSELAHHLRLLPTSASARFILPCSSSKMRSLRILSAMYWASFSVSRFNAPAAPSARARWRKSAHSSTVTDACRTRCTTAAYILLLFSATLRKASSTSERFCILVTAWRSCSCWLPAAPCGWSRAILLLRMDTAVTGRPCPDTKTVISPSRLGGHRPRYAPPR